MQRKWFTTPFLALKSQRILPDLGNYLFFNLVISELIATVFHFAAITVVGAQIVTCRCYESMEQRRNPFRMRIYRRQYISCHRNAKLSLKLQVVSALCGLRNALVVGKYAGNKRSYLR